MILGLSFFGCVQHLRSRYLQTYVGYLHKPCMFALLGSLSRCCVVHKQCNNASRFTKVLPKSNSFRTKHHFWLLPKRSCGGFTALCTAHLLHFIRDTYRKSRHVATTGRAKLVQHRPVVERRGTNGAILKRHTQTKRENSGANLLGRYFFCW